MNESEFPSLSDASTEQMKTRSKKNVIKLVIPLKTYKDEIREKREARPMLENYKTRMCNSLDTNESCWYGDECRFAHSLEELVIRDCHFKDRCRFVKINNGKLVNDGSNICRNKHPQESKDDFIKRTGLSHYKTLAPSHEEINVDDENEEPKVVEESKVESLACDRQTNYNWADTNKSYLIQCSTSVNVLQEPLPSTFKFGGLAQEPLPSTFKFGGLAQEPLPSTFKFGGLAQKPLPSTFKFGGLALSHEKEVLLRVPKVLAMQALELAMNSGNRCIRVEVI